MCNTDKEKAELWMKTVEQLLEESRPAGQSHREVIKKYVRYGGLKRPNLLLFKHRIKLLEQQNWIVLMWFNLDFFYEMFSYEIVLIDFFFFSNLELFWYFFLLFL